jgi:hypothetical protein
MEKLIFETKLNKVDYLMAFFYIISFSLATFFHGFVVFFDTVEGAFFGLVVSILFIIWVVRGLKVFILYSDKLVVRRPLFFTSKFDKVYMIKEIKDVNFYFSRGRFGGNMMCVYTIYCNKYESYRINFKTEERKLFIELLKEIGINVKDDLIQ